MPVPEPYFREAGSGPGVVCLHANASTSAQWRNLMEQLSSQFRVFAPDSYGSGKSPDWHSDHEIALSDEARLLEPVFARAGTPFSLIGHSYGGAVALIAALADTQRIRALVLYEPTLFSLVDAQTPPPNGVDGIRACARAADTALNAGDRDAAAEHFIDFWMGAGSWRQTPPERQPAIAASVANARRWGHALFTEATPAHAFAALDMPILYLLGDSSPESAHAVARVLIPQLPRAEVVEFDGLGHMAPVTHPEIINAEIARFLERHARYSG